MQTRPASRIALSAARGRTRAATAGPMSGSVAASLGSTRAAARTSMRHSTSCGSTRSPWENPPLLIVSDMMRFRIRTNWTNSVSVTHEFTLDDLGDGPIRDKLKWAMSDPERLRPGETRQAVTERGGGDLRRACARLAGLGPRSANGGSLRQPTGVLHVRRGRGPAARQTCSPGCWNAHAVIPKSSRTTPRDCSGQWLRAAMSGSSGWRGSTAGCSTTIPRCRSTGRGSRRRSRRRHSTGRRSTRRSSARFSSGASTRTSARSSGRTTPTATRSCGSSSR